MSWFARILGQWSSFTPSSRRPSKLSLEELEQRLTPSSTTSTNWSGYAINATAGSVTYVSGEFNVPTVSGSGTAYSAAWVGIDGFNSTSVEQTGISADVVNGVAQYSAWYEMYPSAPVTISQLAIHPGDMIQASVSYNNGNFTLSIQDLSDKAGSNSFSITISDPNATRSSAEWIQEAPSSNRGVLPLAKFTPVTFNNAQATVNGTTGVINNPAFASEDVAINMVSASGTQEDTTSALNAAGNGFTVTDGVTTPTNQTPPPSNPTPPTPPPPAPTSVSTTTTLTGQVVADSRIPEVIFTVTVSPSVPLGSEVVLASGSDVIAVGRVEDVNGVEVVQFEILFFHRGIYNFTAEYLGSGAYEGSVSNTVTVTVT
jgi:hypothetical protein